jgi:hypothetical protein
MLRVSSRPQGSADIYKKILENCGKRPMVPSALGTPARVAEALRELERQGLVRLARLYKEGPLIVTEVFDGKAWKRSTIPEKFAKSLTR